MGFTHYLFTNKVQDKNNKGTNKNGFGKAFNALRTLRRDLRLKRLYLFVKKNTVTAILLSQYLECPRAPLEDILDPFPLTPDCISHNPLPRHIINCNHLSPGADWDKISHSSRPYHTPTANTETWTILLAYLYDHIKRSKSLVGPWKMIKGSLLNCTFTSLFLFSNISVTPFFLVPVNLHQQVYCY